MTGNGGHSSQGARLEISETYFCNFLGQDEYLLILFIANPILEVFISSRLAPGALGAFPNSTPLERSASQELFDGWPI